LFYMGMKHSLSLCEKNMNWGRLRTKC